jgi:hypothetical protein
MTATMVTIGAIIEAMMMTTMVIIQMLVGKQSPPGLPFIFSG